MTVELTMTRVLSIYTQTDSHSLTLSLSHTQAQTQAQTGTGKEKRERTCSTKRSISDELVSAALSIIDLSGFSYSM